MKCSECQYSLPALSREAQKPPFKKTVICKETPHPVRKDGEDFCFRFKERPPVDLSISPHKYSVCKESGSWYCSCGERGAAPDKREEHTVKAEVRVKP